MSHRRNHAAPSAERIKSVLSAVAAHSDSSSVKMLRRVGATRHSRALRYVTCAAVVTLVAAGCDRKDHRTAADTSEATLTPEATSTVGATSTIGATSTAGATSQFAAESGQLGQGDVSGLPLGWYMAAQSDMNRSIQDATQSAIAACMDQQGFVYQPVQYVPDRDFLAKRYGVQPWVADRIGYQSVDALETDDSVVDHEPSVPPQDQGVGYELALFGRDESAELLPAGSDSDEADQGFYELRGGCVGFARDAVFETADAAVEYLNADSFIQSLIGQAFAEARAAPEVEEARRDWVECMAGKGYTFGSRDDLVSRGWPEPRPTPDEHDTAVADTRCLEEVGYANALLNAEASAQARLVDENEAAILAARDLLTTGPRSGKQ